MRRRRSDQDPDEVHSSESPVETTEWGSPQCLIVGLDCRSMNLYRFLRVRFPDVPRGTLQAWMSEGEVLVNGGELRDSRPLRAGDIVEITAPLGRPAARSRTAKVEVLHRDREMLVVHKPAGVASTEEGRGGKDLANLLETESSDSGSPWRVVHRLDKHASGIVVLAHSREARRFLVDEYSSGRVQRDALALVSGYVDPEPRVLRYQVAATSGKKTRLNVVPRGGKTTVTLVRRLLEFRGYSLVHARALCGRAHQIRVHLKSMGNAIVGDTIYGGEAKLFLSRLKSNFRPARGEPERPLLARLALHSHTIALTSPLGGDPVQVVAALPRDLKAALRQLQKHLGLTPLDDLNGFLAAPLGAPGADPFEELLQQSPELRDGSFSGGIEEDEFPG